MYLDSVLVRLSLLLFLAVNFYPSYMCAPSDDAAFYSSAVPRRVRVRVRVFFFYWNDR